MSTRSITVPEAMALAKTHHQAGRLAEAQGFYRLVLTHDPRHVDALYWLGVATQQLGDLPGSVSLFEEASRLRPDNPVVLNGLGNALVALQRFADAESAYRRALALNPEFPEAHSNLANVQHALGRLEEAALSARQALALRPDFQEAHNNLGNTLGALGHTAEAETHLRRAIALKPDFAEAHSNLGNVFRKLGRPAEAANCYRAALAVSPRYAQAHFNLGNVLQDTGRWHEAELSYGNAIALKPDFLHARLLRIHARRQLCAWSQLESEPACSAAELGSGGVHPFMLLFSPEATPQQQLATARAFTEREYGRILAAPPLCGARPRAARAKLRIGYLSADFRDHPVSQLLVNVIERHDRGRFAVHGYFHGQADDSRTGRRIRGAFDLLRNLQHASDSDAARSITGDEIDILVDLGGHTASQRIRITALRPAPVQVNWWGYPGTLGHPRLADYLIGDPIVTPLEQTAAYSEALALMPHCYMPNDPLRPIGARPTHEAAGLPRNALVFCSFNQAAKITAAMFGLWCSLLDAVPGSILWLLDPTAPTRANLLHEAATRGIAPERLIFAPRLPAEQHLGRLQLADVALDTYPYTSHTTASDALWAGVPLVTFPGAMFVSRVAASALAAAGLRELVTSDPEAYFRLALRLATHPQALKEIRDKLAKNRDNCPLFDSRSFTRNLEQLYERMWEQHCAGKRAPIVLP